MYKYLILEIIFKLGSVKTKIMILISPNILYESAVT